MDVVELKEGRAERGLTQRQLAEQTGLSLGTINAYEQGVRNISAESASKIEAVFKSISPITMRQEVTYTAELSNEKTILQWEGTSLRPPEAELLKVLAKTMVNQRK